MLIITLCLLASAVGPTSTSGHSAGSGNVRAENEPQLTDVCDQRWAYQTDMNKIDSGQITALNFAIRLVRNETEVDFAKKLIKGTANWFNLRQDFDFCKFKEIYSHYIVDTCIRVRFIGSTYKKYIDEVLSQDPIRHQEFKLRLYSCGVLLNSSVRSSIKRRIFNLRCKNKVRDISSNFLYGLSCCAIATCCIGADVVSAVKD